MASEIVDMTDDNYEQLLQEHSLIFVDCWSITCQPCLALNPLFDRLQQEFGSEILIAKLDILSNPKLWRKYEIQGLPAFLAFQDGVFLTKYPWMLFSFNPEETLRKAITDLIS